MRERGRVGVGGGESFRCGSGTKNETASEVKQGKGKERGGKASKGKARDGVIFQGLIIDSNAAFLV